MKYSGAWKTYFWFYMALGLIAIPFVVQLRLPFQILRATVLWFPALLGLFIFSYNKRKVFPLFWKFYFVYYVADIIYEWFWLKFFLVSSMDMGIALIGVVYILEILILLPSMFALYELGRK